jgi:hypothetical protein
MILQEEYNLNLESQLSKKYVKVSQYDTGRRLLITLLKNDCSMFKIPSEASASINGLKPDGKGFRYDCSIENNKVVVDMKEQMTVLAGCVKCEILLSKGGERIATANFMLSVEESPLSENTLISSTDIPLLQKAIEASEIVLSVEKNVKGYSESASKSSQSAQKSAESASNASASSAESARNSSQSAQASAESANNASQSATNAQESAESASNSAREAKTSADSAIQTKAEVEQLKKETVEQTKTLTDSAKQEISTVKDATVTEVTELKNSTVSEITSLKDSTIEAVTLLKDNAKAEADRATESSTSAKVQAEKAQASADSIANVTSDVEKLKEDLPNKITKFYASNQGETHITDSDNGKIQDMMLYGESEQFTTTGKNLLKIRDGTQTLRGVTVTAKDGVVALKGTATETGWSILDIDSFVLDGRYTLSSNSTNIVGVVLASKSFKTVIQHNKPATLENEEVSKICFTVTNGKTYNISNVLIQLEKGSEATSYEPYTGGKPSPNLDYPQEIKNVVNPTVKVCGANIMRLNDIKEATFSKSGITISIKDGLVKAKGTVLENETISTDVTGQIRFLNPLTLQSGKTYIYNPNPVKGAESNGCYLDFTNSHTLGFSLVNGNLNKPIKVTDLQVQFPFVLNLILRKGTVVDIEWKPQMLLNEVLLPYKPYKEQSIQLPITLNAIPVSSGGNVTINGQQYISDRLVEKDGVYGIERNVVDALKNISNQSIEIDLTRNNTARFRIASTDMLESSVYVCICNILPYGVIWNEDNEGVYTDSQYVILRINKSTCGEDEQTAKDWLISNINKFHVYACLKNSKFEPLSSDAQEKLKMLSTYYPVTNITAVSEQLDGYTVFNYPISMANGWNYVKQQLNDNRDYIYDMDLQSAEAYVNSEYAVTLTELEV